MDVRKQVRRTVCKGRKERESMNDCAHSSLINDRTSGRERGRFIGLTESSILENLSMTKERVLVFITMLRVIDIR